LRCSTWAPPPSPPPAPGHRYRVRCQLDRDRGRRLRRLRHRPTGATAIAGINGSFDYAFVFDPLGTVGSTAHAEGTFGLINSMDLAGVFGDMLHANATADSNLVEILPSLFG
jgi:hypothetical protein